MPITNERAPSHRKPALPRMTDVAARVRAGETLDQVAAEYERRGVSLIPHLANAGFSVDGHPIREHPIDDRPPALHTWVMPDWYVDALCAQVDPELYYPDTGGTVGPAKRVCLRCPVRPKCLDYAFDNDEPWGVWGGMSAHERHQVRMGRKPMPTFPDGAQADEHVHPPVAAQVRAHETTDRSCPTCGQVLNTTPIGLANHQRRHQRDTAA